MTNEQLRMQMLAGVITEGEYTAIINKEIEEADKTSLNESMIGGIVGVGAINQIPATPKTDYEMAFEHFLGERYQVKPNRERDDIKDINEEDTVEDMEERTEEEMNEELSDSDAIYDTLMKMDHEELVGALLAAGEEAGLSLEDWLNGYDHSNLGENN